MILLIGDGLAGNQPPTRGSTVAQSTGRDSAGELQCRGGVL